MLTNTPPSPPPPVADDFVETMTRVRRHYDLGNTKTAQRILTAFVNRTAGRDDPGTIKLMEAATLIMSAIEPRVRVKHPCACGHTLWRDEAGNLMCTNGHEVQPVPLSG